MEGKLPTPYVLEMKGDIPNMYIPLLGAGCYASLVGENLIRNSNAFRAFLKRCSDKTGLEFDKGLFGYEEFIRAFVYTLIGLYSAYTSVRSQYLISKGISESELPVYTSFDDALIVLEFSANSPHENLDEILKKNKEIHDTARSRWSKEIIKGVAPQYTTPSESPSKEELPDKPKEEKPGLKDEKQDKNQE